MYGDFTKALRRPRPNERGVVHQQGRVLLDADTNAQTAINTHWQERLAEAALGRNIAAVSTYAEDSFLVTKIEEVAGEILVELRAGELWADGLLFSVDAPDPFTRSATFLNAPATPFGTAGTRDAIVLELWDETLSAYQRPEELIEPALGGVDTVERVETMMALRLWRLDDGERCTDIHDKLRDDPSTRGTLRATLPPSTPPTGDCPVEINGGYVGFEHYLYRVEIAETTSGPQRFKWSRFNGGLVGRGDFDASARKVRLHQNREAILRSGRTDFYLEALDYDPVAGHWRVIYGVDASIDADRDLSLAASHDFGAPLTGSHFFRLWDSLESVAAPPTLPGGVNLSFDVTKPLSPGDYWTFPLRVDHTNPTTLVDGPPEGPIRRRAPLAIATHGAGPAELDDCRRVFNPLTRLSTCCTVRVGDGVTSFGDVRTIREALNRLPPEGGRVCVLPGRYEESVIIGRSDVIVEGCGALTQIVSDAADTDGSPAALFTVFDADRVQLRDMTLVPANHGVGVYAKGSKPGNVHALHVEGLTIHARRNAALHTVDSRGLDVVGCTIHAMNVDSNWPAVILHGHDMRFERNIVEAARPSDGGATSDAIGGVWIQGGSERVRIVDNDIRHGRGHGITLGHFEEERFDTDFGFKGDYNAREWIEGRNKARGSLWSSDDTNGWSRDLYIDEGGYGFGIIGMWSGIFGDCGPCGPGTIDEPGFTPVPGEPIPVAGPSLTDIHVEDNRIHSMGLSGIGIFGFLRAVEQGVIEVNGLHILRNEIDRCVSARVAALGEDTESLMGYGAISLGIVEDFRCADNLITAYGFDHVDAVCGIYVYYGIGVDILRNEVRQGGGLVRETRSLSRGARGGIYLDYAEAPFALDVTDGAFGKYDTAKGKLKWENVIKKYYRSFAIAGAPALVVEGNRVESLTGRALTATLLGDTRVNDNWLAAFGRASQTIIGMGLAVRLLNLGMTHDAPLSFDSFCGIKVRNQYGKGLQQMYKTAPPAEEAAAKEEPARGLVTNQGHQEVLDGIQFDGSNLQSGYGTMRTPSFGVGLGLGFGGNIAFNDNQVSTVALEGRVIFGNAVLCVTLDDLLVSSNQFELQNPKFPVMTQALLIGFTTRVLGNRLTETLGTTAFSAITRGLLNTTSHNHSTHCLLAEAPLLVEDRNIELIRLRGRCGYFKTGLTTELVETYNQNSRDTILGLLR
ncbi:MAG: DUF6519 domain-containing protein [Deltaproteobacteria bacterium]